VLQGVHHTLPALSCTQNLTKMDGTIDWGNRDVDLVTQTSPSGAAETILAPTAIQYFASNDHRIPDDTKFEKNQFLMQEKKFTLEFRTCSNCLSGRNSNCDLKS
jgi:hypothetical protein